MNRFQLKNLLSDKKKQLRSLVDGCGSGESVREFTAEEETRFSELEKEVSSIKTAIARLESVGDEEDEYDDENGTGARDSMCDNPGSGRRESVPGRTAAPSAFNRRSEPMLVRGPAVHTKKHTYSLREAYQGYVSGRFNGVSREVHDRITEETGRTAQGFFQPLGNEEYLREFFVTDDAPRQRNDLTTGTGAGAIFTTPRLPYIDLLRSKCVLSALGVQWVTGCKGKFGIPRVTSATTPGGAAESGGNTSIPSSVSASAPGIDDVVFSDHTVVTTTKMDRNWLNQTSLDSDNFIRNTQARDMAVQIEVASLLGLYGVTGLINESGLNSVVMGTNGGTPTYQNMIQLKAKVANANAEVGRLGFLTSPSMRGTLEYVPKQPPGSSYFYGYVWEDKGPGPGGIPVGSCCGYPGYATSLIPSNGTKGTGTQVSSIFYGNWEDSMLAIWGAIDTIIDPYTSKGSGSIEVSLIASIDFHPLHGYSFAVIPDAIWF